MLAEGITRSDVLRCAIAMQSTGDATDSQSERYIGSDRMLSWALDTVAMNDAVHEEIAAGDGSWAVRLGRFTLYCDPQGFRLGVDHGSVGDAAAAMADAMTHWGVCDHD